MAVWASSDAASIELNETLATTVKPHKATAAFMAAGDRDAYPTLAVAAATTTPLLCLTPLSAPPTTFTTESVPNSKSRRDPFHESDSDDDNRVADFPGNDTQPIDGFAGDEGPPEDWESLEIGNGGELGHVEDIDTQPINTPLTPAQPKEKPPTPEQLDVPVSANKDKGGRKAVMEAPKKSSRKRQRLTRL